MVELSLLTREGCHLCDDARSAIAEVVAGRTVTVTEIDIDTDADLEAQYAWDIPVVLLDGRRHSFHRVDAGRLAAALDALASA